jgi:hypothetical protein
MEANMRMMRTMSGTAGAMRAGVAGLLLVVVALLLAADSARAAELVMFDDPSCVWCRRWNKEIGAGYGNTDEGRRAPLRRVHIKDQAKAGVVLKRRVLGTPTFVLVEDGREVDRMEGYVGADFFYPQLGELLAKLPPAEPAEPRRPALRETHAR